ncbi:hypothetical protein IFM89_004207 [Coptis chinensis]|uniref:Uncharacterized protein n=1 Tax=Coptis chinensis TaxID=261450 RepID=A0A835I9S4_9MAGN|nr:hypothetical protein IFM89_004207 [Coptis chinensis]
MVVVGVGVAKGGREPGGIVRGGGEVAGGVGGGAAVGGGEEAKGGVVAGGEEGCGDTMIVRWSSKECNFGQRFLRCKGASRCGCFKWIDLEVDVKEKGKVVAVNEEEDERKGKGKLKLCIDNPIKMHIEGNVSDVTELVRKVNM